jgi:hypothetical protein
MEVTHAVLDELRAEGYQSFLKEEDTAAWLGVMGVPEPLEQIEQRTLLDGYATTVTEKRSVHSLMLHLYLSIIPQTVLEHVQDIIRRVLPNHEISFSSSMRSLLPAIAEVRSPLSKRGVLVEVSGQMTNVGIVDDGVLLAVRTIPHGTHDILRAVAPSARSLQEAASKFTTVAPTEGSGTVSSVPPELATACTEWRTAAQQAIADLCDGVLSPTHVYLTAPDGYYPVLADAMGKPYVQPVVRTERAHTVVRLAIPEGERPPIGLVADTRLDLFLHTLPR